MRTLRFRRLVGEQRCARVGVRRQLIPQSVTGGYIPAQLGVL
jgi:hypothetical protein